MPRIDNDNAQSHIVHEEGLILEDFMPYRLSVIANKISRALSSIYKDKFGLSIPEWRVLANLGRFEPMSSNQIAERGHMDKAKVSRAVASLLKSGLITRQTDPADHRMLILKMSAKGRKIYTEIAALAQNWEQEFLSHLSPEDIEVFSNNLKSLCLKVTDSPDMAKIDD